MRHPFPSVFPFNDLPRDIGILILEQCSPYDLVQLSATSKRLRKMILLKHVYLWNRARANLERSGISLTLPPCPQVPASGNFSETAYATFLFGGGMCTQCTKPTARLPCIFLFRSRACSRRCKLDIISNLAVDWIQIQDTTPWGRSLPKIPYQVVAGVVYYAFDWKAIQLARQEHDEAIARTCGAAPTPPKLFRSRTRHQLEEEYTKREQSVPILLQNAEQLNLWAAEYCDEQRRVYYRNLKFLQRVVKLADPKISASQVIKSQVFGLIFSAFNRDLQDITLTVWQHHCSAVMTELKPSFKIACPYCKRLIHIDGLHIHVVAKHNDIDKVRLSTPSGKLACFECPNSGRVFTEKGLSDHRRTKHPDHPRRVPSENVDEA
ncbi:Inositol-pentakisphosphate 2-kinase [Mycena indigotica]|uniref:Inositol-pentakisphosphate 2-kinase n=1 Tax=Mycena indigotica TaxID=2126181 RepID=A0A8H6SN84_9AGAR|nr:Inositol-pentakisphosphate 2-kinase [Mycena indigotica]KAF7301965.1 Inositol-pentakisphosphate 2-kinase [Mycena indigotica]